MKRTKVDDFKLFKLNDVENGEFLNIEFDGLCKKASEMITEETNKIIDLFIRNCNETESPIEQIFVIELVRQMQQINNYIFWKEKVFKKGWELIDIEHQGKIENYRVDFVLPYYNFRLAKGHCFAIELDGHEFHEKTKEQAKKDKEKERFLTAEGYTVIRFTGSEIFNDHYAKVKELFKLISSVLEEI